jgi:hypothetical protein
MYASCARRGMVSALHGECTHGVPSIMEEYAWEHQQRDL